MPAEPMDEREMGSGAHDPIERALVDGLVAGSKLAIAEFLERTHHPVNCMACGLTQDRDLRRDWTHTVLIAILDDLASWRFEYRRAGGFWAWFRRRASFRLLDEYRRQRRWQTREAGAAAGEEPPDIEEFAGGEDPEREVERAEIMAAVEDCLRGCEAARVTPSSSITPSNRPLDRHPRSAPCPSCSPASSMLRSPEFRGIP